MWSLERLRRVAVRERDANRWMIVHPRVILSLLARGDVGSLQYQIRIEELENEIGAMRARAICAEPREVDPDPEWVRITEAEQIVSYHRSTIEKLLRTGVISGIKMPEICEDGITRHVWYLDIDELSAYEAMTRRERRRMRAGAVG
jgi:hypothetical protein